MSVCFRVLATMSLALLCSCGGKEEAVERVIPKIDKIKTFILDRMPDEHPTRPYLMEYAWAMNKALDKPGDVDATRNAMQAESCMGVILPGHLASETKIQVDWMLTHEPDRTRAYETYVEKSSTMALSRKELACEA